MKTIAEINVEIIQLKAMLDEMHDPKLEEIGLRLAALQEELIEMDLYGTYTPNS